MRGVAYGFGLFLLMVAAFWAAERVIEWRAEAEPPAAPPVPAPVASAARTEAA